MSSKRRARDTSSDAPNRKAARTSPSDSKDLPKFIMSDIELSDQSTGEEEASSTSCKDDGDNMDDGDENNDDDDDDNDINIDNESEDEDEDEDDDSPTGLSESQLSAYNRAISGESLFITGGAGTGKSFILHRIISGLHRIDRKVYVTAPTGLAASQFEDGRTLHSLICSNIKVDGDVCIVIDEVSMVNGELLDKLGSKVQEGKESWPANVQLICVGDFFQLAPVEGHFPHRSRVWTDLKLRENTIVLSVAFRQSSDVEFVSVLNRLRVGVATHSDIEFLNQSCQHDIDEASVTHLYCKNEPVNEENERRLQFELDKNPDEKVMNYTLKTSHGSSCNKLIKQVLGIDSKSKLSLKGQQGARGGMFLYNLKLVIGCVVMVTVNVDVENGIVNGLRGTVTDLGDDEITISPDGGQGPKIIKRHVRTWGQARVEQFPLRLAWAVTIHKAQGLTIDKAVVDLSKVKCFGQAYTALSRFRCFEDVKLKQMLRADVVWAHKDALKYYNLVASAATETNNIDERLQVTAIADITGSPCILQGHLKRNNPSFVTLTCSILPNVPQSSIDIFCPRKSFSESKVHIVKVTEFSRALRPLTKNTKQTKESKVWNNIPRPEWNVHKFRIETWKITRGGADQKEVVIPTCFGSSDGILSRYARVRLVGTVSKISSDIITVECSTDTCRNNDDDSKAAMHDDATVRLKLKNPPLPLDVGRQYVFSNIATAGAGSGNPLIIDAMSTVTTVKKVSWAPFKRLLSVSPAICSLAEKGVYAEVLACTKDIRSAFVSPLPLLKQTETSPFVKAAKKVEGTVNKFFHQVQYALNRNCSCPDGRDLLAPEIPYLRLGSSHKRGRKYGVGDVLAKKAAENLFDTLNAVKEFVDAKNFSSQQKFVLLEIFCRGFGNDMMNDFFAYNMVEEIVRFTDKITKENEDILQSLQLHVRQVTLENLIQTFEVEIVTGDWQNWCKWMESIDVDNEILDSNFSIPFDQFEKPVLLLPRDLVSDRPSAFKGRMSTLRVEANQIFSDRLQIAQQSVRIRKFFRDAGEVADFASAHVSLIVKDPACVAQDTGLLPCGAYLVELPLQGDYEPYKCLIGDMKFFNDYPEALQQLVLAFVEPIMMDSSAELKCHRVKSVIDVRSSPAQLKRPVFTEGIDLVSDMTTQHRKNAKKEVKNAPDPYSWAIDNSKVQIGMLCRNSPSRWLIWAVNRASNDRSNPADMIFQTLQDPDLRLRGPTACFQQLLEQVANPLNNANDNKTTSIRVASFNLRNLGNGETDSKSGKDLKLIVDKVIIDHKLSVVALQEVRVPYWRQGSDTNKLKSKVQLPSQEAPTVKLQFYQATESTGIGKQKEFPAIIIDENIVQPAGNHASNDWHGYVEHSSLTFDAKSPYPYPRVPYYWRLREMSKKTAFIVISVHFAPDKGYLPDANRSKCLQMLLEFVKRTWPHEDVFIVGDFNNYNYDTFSGELKDHGFRTLLPKDETTNYKGNQAYDHIVVAIDRFTDPAKMASVIDLKQLVSATIGTLKGTRKNGLKKWRKQLEKVQKTTQEFYSSLSDHFPVAYDYEKWKNNQLMWLP